MLLLQIMLTNCDQFYQYHGSKSDPSSCSPNKKVLCRIHGLNKTLCVAFCVCATCEGCFPWDPKSSHFREPKRHISSRLSERECVARRVRKVAKHTYGTRMYYGGNNVIRCRCIYIYVCVYIAGAVVPSCGGGDALKGEGDSRFQGGNAANYEV